MKALALTLLTISFFAVSEARANPNPSPTPWAGSVQVQPAASFLVPTIRQMSTVSDWVAGLQGQGAAAESPVAELRIEQSGANILRIRDNAGDKGTGEFLIRQGVASEVVVEVPHAFFDQDTLPIGAQLFDNLSARALLFNTAHRYAAGQSHRHHKHSPTDVAHASRSYFFAAHQGLLQAKRNALVIALHGFEREQGDADIIVSDVGTAAPSACVSRELRSVFKGRKVATFAEDTMKLGGLRGVQAHHTRSVRGRMLHLEMSRRVRRQLVKSPKLAEGFSQALSRCM